MAFFDKVGATLSTFGNDVSSKTKSMVEVSNLNGQLKNCEESLKDYYREIGELYYTRNKDNPEAYMTGLFQKVKEAEDAIKHLQDSIRRAKGTTVCPNCNMELPAGTVFCSACGSKVEAAAEETKEEYAGKCEKCGSDLKVGAAFCANCGAKV